MLSTGSRWQCQSLSHDTLTVAVSHSVAVQIQGCLIPKLRKQLIHVNKFPPRIQSAGLFGTGGRPSPMYTLCRCEGQSHHQMVPSCKTLLPLRLMRQEGRVGFRECCPRLMAGLVCSQLLVCHQAHPTGASCPVLQGEQRRCAAHITIASQHQHYYW